MRARGVAAGVAAVFLQAAVIGFPDGMPDPKPVVESVYPDSLWVRAAGTRESKLAEVPAGSRVLVIYGADLRESNVKGELTFTLTVNDPAAYEAVLEVQPETAQDHLMVLELWSQKGDPPVSTIFSIAKQECG